MAHLGVNSSCEAPPEKRQRLGDENCEPNSFTPACPQLSSEQLARIQQNRLAALERRRQSALSGQSGQPEKPEQSGQPEQLGCDVVSFGTVTPAASAVSSTPASADATAVPTVSTCGPALPGNVVLTAEQRSQIEQRRLAALERRRALKAEATNAEPDRAAEAPVSATETKVPTDTPAPMSPAPSAPPSPATSSSSSGTSLLAHSAAPSSPISSAPSSPKSAQLSDVGEDGECSEPGEGGLDNDAASCSGSGTSSSSTSSSDEDGDCSEPGEGGDSEEECSSQVSPDIEEERQSCDEGDVDRISSHDLLAASEHVACAPAPISPRQAVCGCAICTPPPSVAVPPPKTAQGVDIRTAKQHLVAQVLCRWWYVMPDWPPADYNWESALAKHRLRRVPLQRFDHEPEIDERGFEKVYELGQFKGLFRAVGDRLYDLRPVAGRPSYDQLMQKSTPELHRLLVAAYTEQLAELERQPAKAGYCMEEAKQVLRQKVKDVKQKASFSLMFVAKATTNVKE